MEFASWEFHLAKNLAEMIKQRKLNNSQIFIPNLHPLKIPDLFTGGQFSATWQGAPSWCYLRLHRVWLVSQPPHLWEGEFSWNLLWLPFGSCFFSSIERQVIQIYGESCFISENISIPPKNEEKKSLHHRSPRWNSPLKTTPKSPGECNHRNLINLWLCQNFQNL